MKPDNRTPAEISKDLDAQAEEVLRTSKGPSDLTNVIGQQNPFKSAEQIFDPAPPSKMVDDPKKPNIGCLEGEDLGSYI